MALIFLSESEAKTLCKTDLEKVNPPEIVSKTKMMAYVLQVADWCKDSSTAKFVMDTVKKSPVPIYVVGMKGGGFSCFNSDYPHVGAGTIYYNVTLDMAVKFKSSGPHDTASNMSLEKREGLRTQDMPPAALHNYIGFLHELGHAKQFIENPLFMEGSVMNSPEFAAEIEAAARVRKDHWKKVQDPKYQTELARLARARGIVLPQAGTSSAAERKPAPAAAPVPPMPPRGVPVPPAPGRNPAPPPVGAPAPPMPPGPPPAGGRALARDPYQLQSLRVVKPQWGVRIETDNLMRHEWPICEEMGYPKRNYTDLLVLKE